MGVSEFPDLYRFVAILEGVVSLRCFFFRHHSLMSGVVTSFMDKTPVNFYS